MYKIVVDSGCDLHDKLVEDKGVCVEVVPLQLQLADKQFIDNCDLDLDEYLDEMSKCPTVPKTAAPSPGAYLDAYKRDTGESSSNGVFAVTLSSNLSGSYSSALLARQMYLDEMGTRLIHVFDSLSASVGETVIALKIQEFIKANLGFTEIVEGVNTFISGMHTYFILERFENLVKNGRMNAYIAKIASCLSIKPICAADGNGRITMASKARGYKKAMMKMVDIIAGENLDCENRILGISHVKCLDKALELKEEILKRFSFKDVIIVEASGLCSTYADQQGIIVSC